MEKAVDRFLAAIKKIIIQAIDWLFWFISFAWNWSFGQISRALDQTFQTLPDWKAVLYALLVVLLLYIAYLVIPRIVGSVLAIFRAIWAFLETLFKIAIDMVWYVLIAYGIALVINTFKAAAIVGKMPWQ